MAYLKKPVVSIVKTPLRPDISEVEAAVRKAVALSGGLPEGIAPDRTVLLKPNLVDIPLTRESGAVTHPYICRAVAEMVKERGALPVIADSSGIGADTEAVIDFMGYDELRREGFTVLDLKGDSITRIINPCAGVLQEMLVYDTALQADYIINLPVLKTHDQAEVTLSLKNLKGLLADCSKKAMHRKGLFQGIPEIAQFFGPCFTVLDGIYAQEGIGPVFGDPVEMDLIMAGRDMVALDTIAGLIMGYSPAECPVSVAAGKMGLGEADPSQIEVRGLPWTSVKRPFRRCSDAGITGDKDASYSIMINSDTCTGCRNTIIAVLVELRDTDRLSQLEGKTIIAGTPPRKLPPGQLIFIGACAGTLRDRGIFVEGCPPENSWVIEELIRQKE